MQLTRLAWLGGLLGLALIEPQVCGYVFATGTGTSPPTVTGTDPGSSVPATSAPYGNSTGTYYPTGTAPCSTGVYPTFTDPTGTAPSTGLPSASSVAFKYARGLPAEYFYHHKKPKRNAPNGRGYQA